jgi:hypothetical protein
MKGHRNKIGGGAVKTAAVTTAVWLGIGATAL